jgi:excisionase family DNA binding protein
MVAGRGLYIQVCTTLPKAHWPLPSYSTAQGEFRCWTHLGSPHREFRLRCLCTGSRLADSSHQLLFLLPTNTTDHKAAPLRTIVSAGSETSLFGVWEFRTKYLRGRSGPGRGTARQHTSRTTWTPAAYPFTFWQVNRFKTSANERNAVRHGAVGSTAAIYILGIQISRDPIMSTSHAPLTHQNDATEQSKTHVIDQLPPQQHGLSGPRGLLRVEEAAAWLGLGRTKTYELVGCGALASVCIGRSRRVPVSALETFIERLALDGHL